MPRRIALAALLALAPLAAQTALPGLNVRDFGAKGDAVTDDTAALQAALDAQSNSLSSAQIGIYFGSSPTLFFPAGRYRISETLNVGSYSVLLGEQSTLEQTDPAKDTLRMMGYRNAIGGMTFIGGKRAVVIKTNNVDTCMPRVERCEFLHTTGPAIETEEPSNSTLLTVRDCLFLDCDQVLVNRCDKASVTDCWITTSRAMKNKAVFENRGILHLERIVGVPLVDREADQRWIDNYNGVSCRAVRFGGEDAGITAVVNFAPYDATYPVWPTYVMLDDCDLYCLGNPQRKAAIWLVAAPNQIVVRGCHGLADLPVIGVDPKLDLAASLAAATARPGCLKYLVEDSSSEVLGELGALPEALRPFGR